MLLLAKVNPIILLEDDSCESKDRQNGKHQSNFMQEIKSSKDYMLIKQSRGVTLHDATYAYLKMQIKRINPYLYNKIYNIV